MNWYKNSLMHSVNTLSITMRIIFRLLKKNKALTNQDQKDKWEVTEVRRKAADKQKCTVL